MMKRTLTHSMLVTVAAAGIALSTSPASNGLVAAGALGQNQQDELALSLRNPGTHPRVGLPDFVWASGSAELAAHAKTVADVLWDDLDFEREYYMVPRKASAGIPVARAEALPFDQWATIGADLVLVGEARGNGRNITVELRLVSTRGETRGRQYFGMRYECGVESARGPRDCAHQIADDFHKQNRNLDGVARTKLAFTSDRDASRVSGRPTQTAAAGKEIYLSDYDGANQIRFTTNRTINISPSWSPTGGLLSYTSYSSGFPDVYVANLRESGRGLQRPAHGDERVHNQLSAWSPDGSKLAFMSNRSGNNDIWIVNRDGSGLQNLTNHPLSDSSPAWSPDGGQIAFASDRAGANQLYVMSVNGSGLRRLFDARIDRPTWSSLNFLAFTIGSGPGFDIAIWDFNNPGVRVLTDSTGSNESPAIAPNGRHIAFVTTRWGRQQIAVMDRTGQNIRRITEAGNNTYPNWQPIAKR